MIEVQVAHLGLDQSTNSPVVLLKERDGERVLSIWIGPAEASAIAMEMQGVKAQRPMTHDLLKHRRVTITNVRDNTYFAELLIRRDEQVVQVDARPSDSIALALRLHAPIFTSDDLLDQNAGGTGPPAPERRLDAESLKQYLEKLDPQDFGRFTP
jgi:bifunctional DNase/RNase